jgi:hypothetical protein
MRIIDSHVHLGDIYGLFPNFNLEDRTPETTYLFNPNIYERMKFRNIYFGKLNYLFKPLIAGSAKTMTQYANLPNLLDSMRRTGVERSIVLALEPYVPTDRILAICRKNKNLIPFCSVHPYDKDKKDKLKRYIESGARGLKLHPVIQAVSPNDPATFEVLEEVKAYGIPVLFHVGWGSIGKGNYGLAENYKKLLDNFKDIPLIFAHIGFYEPFALMEIAAGHDNVYGDISWQPAGIIKKALDKFGSDRLIFGSDWPYNLQNTPLSIVLEVTKGKPDLQDKILYKNIAHLLNLG